MTRHEIMQEMQAEPTGGGMTVIIPSVVMKDPALSRSAKMLYGIITWKCNEFAYCWHSNRALGDELGLSGKRISALLSELSAQGHIEVEIIKDEGGAIIQRRLYPIVKSSRGLLYPHPENEAPHPKNEHTPPQEQGYPHLKNEAEKNKRERKKENSPPVSPTKQSRFAPTPEAQALLDKYAGDDIELKARLSSLVENRVKLRTLHTAAAVTLLLNKLDKLSGGRRQAKLELLDEAIEKGWKSVYDHRDRDAPSGPTGGWAADPEVMSG